MDELVYITITLVTYVHGMEITSMKCTGYRSHMEVVEMSDEVGSGRLTINLSTELDLTTEDRSIASKL